MAQEVTTNSLASITHAYLIQPVIIAALSEQPGFAVRNCREFDIRSQPTNAAQIPLEIAYWGAPGDRGVGGLKSNFRGAQAVSLANTAYSSGSVTITCGEYGIAHTVVDNVSEDSVSGIDLMTIFSSRMTRVLQLAMDYDYLALLPSAVNFVGTTNTAVTVAQLIAAQQGLRSRGVVADAQSMAYLLGNVPANYLESALSATSTSIASFALSADRLINYAPTANNGMDASRKIASFRGLPVFTSGLTLTANAGVDDVGACICATSAENDNTGATSHAMAWKRLPRFETQRFAKQRALDIVMTARAGFAKLQENATTAIITKAS